MIRKIIPLLLFLTGVIPFACCPEQLTGPYKVELNQITLLKSNYMRAGYIYNDSTWVKPNETYLGDTLLLSFGLSYQLAHQPVSVSLYASALAWSCDESPGYTFLQDKITSMEIYSDQPYHGIPAGEPLNDKVSVYNYRSKQTIPLQQAIANMNTLQFYEGMDKGLESIVLSGKPTEPAERTFTVRIDYESGRENTVTSIPVRW